MNFTKLLEKATKNAAEAIKEKWVGIQKNPEVPKDNKNDGWYPNEADFVAEIYCSLKKELKNNSKYLILEGTPYAKTLGIRPDISYNDGESSFLAEVKTIISIAPSDIKVIKDDCTSLDHFKKDFDEVFHIILFTIFNHKNKAITNDEIETRVKNVLKCEHSRIIEKVILK